MSLKTSLSPLRVITLTWHTSLCHVVSGNIYLEVFLFGERVKVYFFFYHKLNWKWKDIWLCFTRLFVVFSLFFRTPSKYPVLTFQNNDMQQIWALYCGKADKTFGRWVIKAEKQPSSSGIFHEIFTFGNICNFLSQKNSILEHSHQCFWVSKIKLE